MKMGRHESCGVKHVAQDFYLQVIEWGWGSGTTESRHIGITLLCAGGRGETGRRRSKYWQVWMWRMTL